MLAENTEKSKRIKIKFNHGKTLSSKAKEKRKEAGFTAPVSARMLVGLANGVAGRQGGESTEER